MFASAPIDSLAPSSATVRAKDVLEGRTPLPDGPEINAWRIRCAQEGDEVAYQLWGRIRWRWVMAQRSAEAKDGVS